MASNLAVFPRCQIDSADILHDVRRCTRADPADQQHDRNIQYEQYRKNVQIVHILECRDEFGNGVQNNVHHDRYLGGTSGNISGEHTDDDRRQNRHVEEAEAGLEEVIQTGGGKADDRRHADRNDGKHGAEDLADAGTSCASVACGLNSGR